MRNHGGEIREWRDPYMRGWASGRLKEQPHIIDVNPNPGISRKAGFAKSAEKAGAPHPQLIRRIMGLAVERHLTLKLVESIKIRKMAKTNVPIVLNLLDAIPAFKGMEVAVARGH